MKNITKTIASIGLSLLAIGAMAQTPANFSQIKHGKPIPVNKTMLHRNNSGSTNRVLGGPQNYIIDYPVGDQTINSGYQFADGYSNLFVFNINNALTIADSGVNENISANNVTCVFDTVWDYNTQDYVPNIAKGSVTVDSIEVLVHYHNTSGHNDTVILSINSVTTNGYPSTTIVYGVDTAVITPGFFQYNIIDSEQAFVVKKPVNIPSTARHGWNFGVQMTVHAPKHQDTVALVWTMQVSTACAALNGAYVPEPTSIGVKNGAVSAVNTFANGYWWYDKAGNLGNNTSLAWPLTSGSQQGFYENAGTEYWAPLAATDLQCCGGCNGDTLQWNIQDVYIIPFITATSTQGINNITAPDFSINQNFPNPFNKNTQITYNLTKPADVMFTVYDVTGRELINNNYSTVAPGQHAINIEANQFTPGIYFYTFNVSGTQVTKKMIITQ